MTRFHRSLLSMAALPAAGLVFLATSVAQPPDGPPPRGPADPLRAALDTNGDFELDADEIAAAADALAKLDENGDGRIDRQEFRPPMPPRNRGPGRERDEAGERRPRDRGPEGRPPRGEEAEGRRPRERARPDGPPGERPRGPRERPAEGGPSPERFVERAMEFDADGDGKLDRDELGRFAEGMMERMRGNLRERVRGEGPPRRRPAESG